MPRNATSLEIQVAPAIAARRRGMSIHTCSYEACWMAAREGARTIAQMIGRKDCCHRTASIEAGIARKENVSGGSWDK